MMQEIEIPNEAHVRCPLRSFHLIPARRCDGCENFRGLTDAFSNDAIPFEKRFQVRCTFPIDRELAYVEVSA